MAYASNNTRNTSGLHPSLRGLGSYAAMSTRSSAGLHPNFRGLGDAPLTSISMGPGGQFSISTATIPTTTSIWDQMLTWLGSSTIVAGMPNSIFALGGGILLLRAFGGRRHR